MKNIAAKIRRKLCLLLILSMLFQPITVYADQVTKVNTTLGYFTGMYAQYKFHIPSFWENYITAERIRTESSNVVEEVKIFCTSVSGKQDPALLLSFKVYDTRNYSDHLSNAHDVVIKAKYYTFGINKGLRQPFITEVDKGVYMNCYQYIDTYNEIKGLFEFPEGHGEIPTGTLFVNGKNLGKQIVTKEGHSYVPMRLVCEEMGYTVTYMPYSHAVRVDKPNFTDIFYFTSYSNILFLIENGTTYISTAYFYRILGANIELDSNKNIYIT